MHCDDGIALVRTCLIGWPRSSFGIVGSTVALVPEVPEGGVGRGVRGVPVVGVDHVAGRAAGGAVVAGVIVGAEHVERRVEQARLLQAQEDGVGAQQRSEPADGELVVGAALLDRRRVRVADLGHRASAALEHAQDVAGLRDLPPSAAARATRRTRLRPDLLVGRRRERAAPSPASRRACRTRRRPRSLSGRRRCCRARSPTASRRGASSRSRRS